MGITKKKMKLSIFTAALIGVEGRSPPSEEMLSLFNLELSREDCASAMCPRHYNPVCASNGVTFGNECTFRVARCDEPELLAVSLGPCAATTGSPTPPSAYSKTSSARTVSSRWSTPESARKTAPWRAREYRPTCGSDGNVHSNP